MGWQRKVADPAPAWKVPAPVALSVCFCLIRADSTMLCPRRSRRASLPVSLQNVRQSWLEQVLLRYSKILQRTKLMKVERKRETERERSVCERDLRDFLT